MSHYSKKNASNAKDGNRKPFKLPDMVPLPDCRTKIGRAFENIGIDMFGPITFVVKKAKEIENR